MSERYHFLINNIKLSKPLQLIGHKIIQNKRISIDEALVLYNESELPFLASLAHHVRTLKNADFVYYIKNIHIEYTNQCVNKCVFCSFRSRSANDIWELSPENIIDIVRQNMINGIKEVHIVGGVHPDKDIYFWLPILKTIKSAYPHIHIKAFTAAELDYIISKANMSIEEGLKLLKENGLDSIPGGGAEIFDITLQKNLFPTKINWQQWLYIHKTAHKLKIPSNATMLYGHIENIHHRLFHLEKLRELQDETNGFNAFIPLKFKNKNNEMKGVNETMLIEDLKMFALSRIFLDNFPHIKAYWPMLGKEAALLALDFGADDMDGTINNSTVIYSKAGASEQKPQISEAEMIELIKSHRKKPLERDESYQKQVCASLCKRKGIGY